MGGRKLETLLDGGLWFARIDQFKDPLEGTLPKENLGLMRMMSPSDVDYIRRQYLMDKDHEYALCLHLSMEGPAPELWREFDRRCDGVAVEFDRLELQRALAGLKKFGVLHYRRIRYIDHAKETIQPFNTIVAAFVVQKKWTIQNEARYLIHLGSGQGLDQLQAMEGYQGPLIRTRPAKNPKSRPLIEGGHKEGRAIVPMIDPHRVVKRILINPGLEDAQKQKIEAMIRKYGFEDKLYGSV